MAEILPPLEDSLILVVDDEPLNRLLIGRLLRRGGFTNVAVAGDGAAALAFVEDQTPACILLDLMMPEVDGLEVCRHLRADDRFARVPIIVQTALSSREDRRAAFAAGASDVVSKPYDPEELEARVRVHLSNALLSAGLLAYRERMEAELADARAVSEALLPQPGTLAGLAARGVTFSHVYRPCSGVGGDYWNAWALAALEDGAGKVGLIVGDVSGHGVSAALRMSALHTLLTPAPPFAADPLAVAEHLDRRLHALGHARAQYVAGAYVVIDVAAGRFRFVPAGLRDALVWRRGGGLETVSLSGVPFGLFAELPRGVDERLLEPGDTLILYSDALVECAADLKGAPRSEEELCAWLTPLLPDAPDGRRLAPWLGERFLESFGAGVVDDLLIVAARLEG